MAYTIKIGQFAKNIESTAQPNTTGWAEHSVTLKNGADISNPRIELQVSWDDIKDVNYAVMMNRYYWVIGKNMLRENLCQLSLRVDVLATYKKEIGNSSLYVLRAANASDGNIKDNYYPPTMDVVYYSAASAYPNYSYNSGVYIVNVAGSATTGNCTLWQLTPANFQLLFNELFTALQNFGGNFVESVVQYFGGNPTKLLNGVMWFPEGFTTTGTNEVVQIGSWSSSSAKGQIITDPSSHLTDWNPGIDKHPQSATRGEYLNIPPYSYYTLILPAAGAINLDATQLKGCSGIYVIRHVDAFTGRMLYRVITDPDSMTQDPQVLAEVTAQWGVPVAMTGQNNGGSNATGIVSTIGAATAAALSGGAAIPLIAGAAIGGIGTIAGSMNGVSCNTGVGGALVVMDKPMELQSIFFKITDEDNTRNGRPLCQVTTPATLGGFMIVSKGDVVMAGPLPEHEEVKRYLETGFFYE